MTMDAIARLKITLDDVEPKVLRRIEVPLTIRLDRLHLAIQAAMGWTNSHLYEIRARDTGWGLFSRDWGDGPLDASKATLCGLIADTGVKSIKYLYDFGDGWEHTVRIERIASAAAGQSYPRLVEAKGRCPLEDVGGPYGYQEFLEALSDPDHERREEFEEWTDMNFDPNIVDATKLTASLAALAKKWSWKSTVKRKPAK
jgi:hypothetical protein